MCGRELQQVTSLQKGTHKPINSFLFSRYKGEYRRVQIKKFSIASADEASLTSQEATKSVKSQLSLKDPLEIKPLVEVAVVSISMFCYYSLQEVIMANFMKISPNINIHYYYYTVDIQKY